jgi:signal transduction histidine kinase
MTSLSSFVSLDQAEYRTFDVRHGLESALTLLEPQLANGIRVVTVLSPDPVLVRGNVAKLNQAFLHLLQNAITALNGQGRLLVRAARCAERVEIEITDDGCGIPAERLEQLFDFSFTTKSGGRIGLGLGLPASKRAVEELGGTLTIQSEPECGTTVRVTLPAAPTVDSQTPPLN